MGLGCSLQVFARLLCGRPEFSGYTVYAVYSGRSRMEQEDYYDWIGAGCVQPVLYASEEYNRLLATAGVIICDNCLPNHFIKREEQVYLKLCEDIPEKITGCEEDGSICGIGNEQRNCFCADYIVCPDESAMKRLADRYMLSNLGKTKVIYGVLCDKTAEKVLRRVLFLETEKELSEGGLPDNGKKNVLIYPGPLYKNGITSAILSLLDHLDRTKNNYILFVRSDYVKQASEVLKKLPEGVSYYEYSVARALTAEEDPVYEAWNHDSEFSYETAKPVLYRRMERERNRLLSFLRVDTVIHYEGYARDILLLFELMPCRRIIYLHNHMLLEAEKKGIRPEPLCHAYNSYDVAALVSEDQRSVAEQMVAMDGGIPEKANIVLAKNVFLYEQVLNKSKEPFEIDEQTEMSVTEQKLREMLASGKKKFITVGRFLPEKGHERLIRTFDKIHAEYPETGLIIVGGYGYLYEDTIQWANETAAADDIAVIKYLSNPYALLAACDYFVLSSYYEGFGLVLAEADIAGIPCFSTKITGPTGFMTQYGGLLVEDSDEGLAAGMRSCLRGEVPERLNIDYLRYNEEAVEQFEAMLSERVE